MRSEISTASVFGQRALSAGITERLGAAMLREQEKTWHDWFSRADAALYRAKSAGRDSYVIADDLF